jgi:diguanylate cyclase (GGDEF)-like protein
MPSDERHTEPLAAVAVAIAGAVLVVLLDDWAARAAALVAFAALLVLVFRIERLLGAAEMAAGEAEARLEELDDRDPLTGVFRRRRLDEELRRQLALAQRERTRVAVLSLDLAGFDDAVDAYGRATGDELLLAATDVLREALRESDVIGRPQRDCFTVVLPSTDEDAARIVAGKLIRSLRGVKRPKPDGGLIDLHASIGLAVSDPDTSRDAEWLLEASREALARAKSEGGDRLALAAPAALG